MQLLLRAAILLFAMLTATAGAPSAGPWGTFGVVADIHFDPFDSATLAEELRSTPLSELATSLLRKEGAIPITFY